MPYPHGLQVSAARLGLGLSAHITAATMQLHQTIEKMARRDSFIHSRLALLQLISEVAEAFQEERITASHANLSHSYRRGP
jgi:isopentenyl phosphate kinase